MARGQRQAADKNLAMTNAVAANQGTRANKLEDTLIPGYTSLMDTGYLTPEEGTAATTSEMGAATAPFATAEFEGRNRAAATRNPADVTASEEQLAMEEGETAGNQAAELQKEKMAGQERGMYGLNALQQGNQETMARMYGLGPQTLGARAEGPSGDQLAMGYINAFQPKFSPGPG